MKYCFVILFSLLISCSESKCPETSLIKEDEGNPDLIRKSDMFVNGYKKGVREALVEIKKGKMTLYVFGLRGASKNEKNIDTEMGLPYLAIAGCVISDDILGRAEGHNKIIREYVNKDNE